MRKQITSITILSLGVVFGSINLFCATPVHAEEEVVQGTIEMPDDSSLDQNTGSDNNGQDNAITSTSEVAPENNTDEATNADGADGTTMDGDFQSDIILYDVEPEAEIEEETPEPPLWPLVVSASAMGITLIAIIVLNLIGKPQKS